jgi:hypothetical protein
MSVFWNTVVTASTSMEGGDAGSLLYIHFYEALEISILYCRSATDLRNDRCALDVILCVYMEPTAHQAKYHHQAIESSSYILITTHNPVSCDFDTVE